MLQHQEGVVGRYLSLPDRFEYVAPDGPDADNIQVALLVSPVGADLIFVLHNTPHAKLWQTTVDNVFPLIDNELRALMRDFLGTLDSILDRLRRVGGGDEALSELARRAIESGDELKTKMHKLFDMTDLVVSAPRVGAERIELKGLVEEMPLAVKDRAGNQRQHIYLAGFEEVCRRCMAAGPGWAGR